MPMGRILVNDGTGIAHVQINDPIGRFSKGLSPDHRFTIDEDNATIRAVTGFPMCLPRTDPTAANRTWHWRRPAVPAKQSAS